jgi:hypothetical protein
MQQIMKVSHKAVPTNYKLFHKITANKEERCSKLNDLQGCDVNAVNKGILWIGLHLEAGGVRVSGGGRWQKAQADKLTGPVTAV